MDENADSSRGKDEVRFSGKIPYVQSVPEAGGVKESPDAEFRFRVLAMDVRHDPASNGFRKAIHTAPSDHFKADLFVHQGQIRQAQGNEVQLLL